MGEPCFCAHLSRRTFESSYSTSTELPSEVAVTTSTSRVSMNLLFTPILRSVASKSCAHHSSPCPTTKSEKASVTIPAAKGTAYIKEGLYKCCYMAQLITINDVAWLCSASASAETRTLSTHLSLTA